MTAPRPNPCSASLPPLLRGAMALAISGITVVCAAQSVQRGEPAPSSATRAIPGHASGAVVQTVPPAAVSAEPWPSATQATARPDVVAATGDVAGNMAGAPDVRLDSSEQLRLGDLTLKDAEALAVLRNRDLRLAQLSRIDAQAGIVSAAAAPNPVLTISALRGFGHDSPHYNDANAGLAQLFERGGKRRLRTQAAQAQAGAAEYGVAEAVLQQKLLVIDAFHDLLAAQNRVDLSADLSALSERTLAAAELRLRAGDLPNSEVTRIRIDGLRVRNENRQAEAERDRARIALSTLLGVEAYATQLRVRGSAPPVPGVGASSSAALEPDEFRRIVALRPAVQAAQARVRAAQSSLALARALRSRDVTVGANVDHQPSAASNTGRVSNAVGLSVSVPLHLRYGYEGEIRAAENGIDVATAQFEQARGLAWASLEQRWRQMQAAGDLARRYQQELSPNAERSMRAAEFAFRNGAIGATDLLDARRTNRAVRNEAIEADADWSRALAGWRAISASATQDAATTSLENAVDE